MSYIPKNLNSDFLTDDDIRNYYSLTLRHEFRDQFIEKIIIEYMDGNQKFKTENAKRSFKKRLKSSINDPPKNSKVYNAFCSWRVSRIHYHISKQNKLLLDRSPEATQEKRILDLEYQVKKLTEEKQKLIQENNELKSGKIYYEDVEEEEEEVIVEEVVEVVEEVVEEVKEEVKEEVNNLLEEITGQYETCENLEEGIELYNETCKKKMEQLKGGYLQSKTDDNFRELVSIFGHWQEEERERLDDCHDIDMKGPDSWDNLFEKQLEKFKNELNYFCD